jgi:hypothetical protein
MTGKAALTAHYASGIGLPASATALVGWFEIGLAVAIAVRPATALLLLAAAGKLERVAVDRIGRRSGSPSNAPEAMQQRHRAGGSDPVEATGTRAALKRYPDRHASATRAALIAGWEAQSGIPVPLGAVLKAARARMNRTMP